MSGHADHVDRLNRELDEQLASGAKSPEALAIVAEQERRLAERRAEYRATLAQMSDQAIRHQLQHGAAGGIQRDEIRREAQRRGLLR